ncbi:hypothetical protein TorRG33x02_192720 [Trema orientale]|uniref:Uncharacterized protein n=1 Tax=Trema orientale TaxID=63057 RepID=A0A2P5EHA1_TREOI|nr:hypothetical protein TorRG33x02_192720 [Trema orientale]
MERHRMKKKKHSIEEVRTQSRKKLQQQQQWSQ